MLYRRRILLALIESFGGLLSEKDVCLLLFLYCLRRGKKFYDFFFTSDGLYSLVLHQDKERLTALEFLASNENFQIKGAQFHINQLTMKDRTILLSFVVEMENVRGKDLVHKVSLEGHSSVLEGYRTLITETQKGTIDGSDQRSTESSCLFTLGYEGLSIDAYLSILLSHHITTVIDVRKNPISRKYGFSKKQLMNATTLVGINYTNLPDLGVPSHLRSHLDTPSAYEQLFHYYETDILPEHGEALKRLKEILKDDGRVVLTCFESDPACCHRHKITDHLENDPLFLAPIVHLRFIQNHIASSISSDKGKALRGLLAENAVYSLL